MANHIKTFEDKSILEYDQGQFDGWCVYLTRPAKLRYAPRDAEYFGFFKELGLKYNSQRVYDDFVKIFNLTTNKVEQTVLDQISIIAKTYKSDSTDVDVWFTVVYSGMVAEENKAFTKLGKRIKRLGMHQVLLQNVSPSVAANFSRGKPWLELHNIMKGLGF